MLIGSWLVIPGPETGKSWESYPSFPGWVSDSLLVCVLLVFVYLVFPVSDYYLYLFLGFLFPR